jgi:predicted small metal-binding protein
MENMATKKDAWSAECKDAGIKDCGFMVREHEAKHLVKFVQTHAKATHGLDLTEKAIMGIAKPAKW